MTPPISTDEALAQLLVVEARASVPPQQGQLTAAVVHQSSAETPQGFSDRVSRLIRGLESEDRRLDQAVLVLGDARGDAIARSRYAILRALFSSRVLAPSGRILLVAPRLTDPVARHDIFALAGAVMAESGSSRVELEIRLSGDRVRDERATVRNATVARAGSSRASA